MGARQQSMGSMPPSAMNGGMASSAAMMPQQMRQYNAPVGMNSAGGMPGGVGAAPNAGGRGGMGMAPGGGNAQHPGMPGAPQPGYAQQGDMLAMAMRKQGQVHPGMAPGMGGMMKGPGMGGGVLPQQMGPGGGQGAPGMMGGDGLMPDMPAFDMSDFPSLGGGPRAGPGGAGLGPGVPGGPHMAPMMPKQPQSEFSIQSEDFPELPGAAPRSQSGNGGEDGHGMAAMHGGMQGGMGGGGLGMGNVMQQQLMPDRGGAPGFPGGLRGQQPQQQQQAQQQQQQQQFPGLGGAQGGAFVDPNASTKGSKPVGDANPDRFGLLGLLSVIRMSDPDLTTLALGTDLTTLGLNLNSADSLWKTFASPWADAPSAGEPELSLPDCFVSQQPPRLQPQLLQRFQLETLLYAFYSMPGDEGQLYAAEELYSRGWLYHKELKLWLARVQDAAVAEKTAQFERGSFWVFDLTSWQRVRKDNFVLQYDAVEVRPSAAAQAAAQAVSQGQPVAPSAPGMPVPQ